MNINIKHNAKWGTSKYKVGDIINNKKILEIIPYYTSHCKQTLFKVKVECLKCHRIYTYNSLSALCGANPNYCLQCKSTYIFNGKTYHNWKAIEEEFGVCASTVIKQSKLHNGDVSQVGKNHKSKYCTQSQCHYKIGDIARNRIIIGKEEHNKKNNTDSKYIVKCLTCGKISKVRARDFLTYDCDCICHHKAGTNIISRETPNKGRKYNLPKNITKIRNKYAVRVNASYKEKFCKWVEYYYTPEECLEVLPDLKKLALYYKKTGKYINYGEYLKMGCPELEVDK